MKYLFYFCIVSFLVACGTQKKQTGNQVDYEVLYHANEHNLDYDKAFIVRNLDELNKAYANINKTRMPGLPIPKIDFKSENVVFLPYKIDNEKFNEIHLDKLVEKDGKLHIEVSEALNENELNNPYFKFPFYILKVQGAYQAVEVITQTD